MKFRCTRDVTACGGDQEFEVDAESEEQARKMFEAGEGELVACNAEVTALGEYNLDSIWKDD